MRLLTSSIVIATVLAACAVGAEPVPFRDARITVYIGGVEPLVVPQGGATGVAQVTRGWGGWVESVVLPAGLFSTGALSAPVTDPVAFPIAGLQLTLGNLEGAFRRDPFFGSLRGTMPLLGVTKVCLFATCAGLPLANLSVPVSVAGGGGTATARGAVNLTVRGAPWTTGFTTVYTGPFGSRSYAWGGTWKTASGTNLSLVTPIFISTNLAAMPRVGAFARLDFRLIPEPASLVLLGGGIALLAIAGKRRSSR